MHGDLHQRDRALHAGLPQRDRALHAEHPQQDRAWLPDLPQQDRAWLPDLPQRDRALHGELHPGQDLRGAATVRDLHGLHQEGGPHGGVQGHGTLGVAPMPASWEASGGGGGGKAELPVLPNGASLWSLEIGFVFVGQS